MSGNATMNEEDSMSSMASARPANNGGRKSGVTAASSSRIAQDPRDHDTFYKDLYAYHDNKGTPIDRVPRINGNEIDLHRLYNLVIGRGGWAKVNYRNEWDELLGDFRVADKCVNGAVALKQIYMRYLDRYEKLHFQGSGGGDDNDHRMDDADDDNSNRHKKWNNKTLLNEVPLKYNYGQHLVPEHLRQVHKMSTDLYRASEYDRLIMSLMSPLPNEQDFAINVCTLMSNEGKHTLKIDTCPKLLEVLLGHAGVYSHYTLRSIFLEFYAKIRRNSLQSFWTDCLRDRPNILELAYDDYVDLPAENDPSQLNGDETRVGRCIGEANEFDDGLNCERAGELFDSDGLDFLNLRRGLGTHDYIGQRVHQIATILRNLSYSDENLATLVRNRTFVRFLVMCANIRWGNIHHMGLDMLGNVAGDLQLSDPAGDDLTRSLLSTVADGLESVDRGVIITCLEVLHKLCRHEDNGEHLNKCLTRRTYAQIGMYLSLNDIMLLLYTLECVYALSALGERTCANIVQVGGLIGQLVALVTVEAQSYGPDGCILMRVVETVPAASSVTSSAASNAGGQLHGLNGAAAGSQMVIGNNGQPAGAVVNRWHTLSPSSTAAGVPTAPAVVVVDPPAPPHVQHVVGAAIPPQPAGLYNFSPITPPSTPPAFQQRNVVVQLPAQPRVVAPVVAVASAAPSSFGSAALDVKPPNIVKTESAAPNTPKTALTAQQQIMQDNEQFACVWLRATFEQLAVPSMGRIEQQDLYRMYLTASAKLGRAGVASQLHFPRAVRSVFGASVGPNVSKLSGHDVATATTTSTLYYEGLRIRSKPLPVVHKGTILQGHIQQADPIKTEKKEIVKIESNVQVGTPSLVKPTIGNVATVAAITTSSTAVPMSPTATLSSGASTTTPSSMGGGTTSSTAMIKSLLANKVTTITANAAAPTPQPPLPTAPTASANVVHKMVAGGSKLVASTVSVVSPSLITANMSVHQVAQRQLLQKEKELAIQQQHQQQQQQTIHFSKRIDSNVPPPLAPLSSGSGSGSIASGSITNDPSQSNANLVLVDTSAVDVDATSQDASGKHSPVVTSNKMLADLLDRKSGSPPFVAGDNKLKRKMDALGEVSTTTTKRATGADASGGDSNKAASSSAANLYAKLAASLLEDEDMEEDDDVQIVANTAAATGEHGNQSTQGGGVDNVNVQPSQQQIVIQGQQGQFTIQPHHPQQQQSLFKKPVLLGDGNGGAVVIQQQIIQPATQQRHQIIVTPSQQVVGGSSGSAPLLIQGSNMAPMLMQQQTAGGQPALQITGTTHQPILQAQLAQPQHQLPQQHTQYMLATNAQGQTYLVAQQKPAGMQIQQPQQLQIQQQQPQQLQLQQQQPQQQTLLVQGSGPNKTIYILQQQTVAQPPQLNQPQQLQLQQQQQPLPQQQQQQQQQQQTGIIKTIVGSTTPNTKFAQLPQQVQLVQRQPQHLVIQQQQQQLQVAQSQTQQTVLVQQTQQQQQQLQQSKLMANRPSTTIKPTVVQQQQQQVGGLQKQMQQTPSLSQAKVQPQQPSNQQNTTAVQQPKEPAPSVAIKTSQVVPSVPTAPVAPQTQPTAAQGAVAVVPTSKPNDMDPNWLFVCDWRGCPRKQYRSANELYLHTCQVHCPDNIDPNAEIYCQWGEGPNLCDNLPRKRFSLMTHLFDRHLPAKSLKKAIQRRQLAVATNGNGGGQTSAPVTIIKNPSATAAAAAAAASAATANAAGALASNASDPNGNAATGGWSSSPSAASAAMQAIKRHAMDFANPKELLDENEGPVTKSIRLTAALILRNLVLYTGSAKRSLRFYEPHLASVALSNVESSRTIAQVLYEMSDSRIRK